MRVPILTIASWIRDRPQGATTRDLQEHFRFDCKQAATLLVALRNMKRYVTEWTPGTGAPHSRDCKPGTLKVLAINKPTHHKHPVGAIVGRRVNPIGDDGDILFFNSVYEADLIGGFLNACIYQCLRGKAKSHGGYRWMKRADYDKEIGYV